MKIGDVHIDLLERVDVGDVLCEHVGPLLGQQRRDIPLGLRVFVDSLRFLALADDPADVPLADGHHKAGDRGVVRQRKNIQRFDLAIVRVVELLVDFD